MGLPEGTTIPGRWRLFPSLPRHSLEDWGLLAGLVLGTRHIPAVPLCAGHWGTAGGQPPGGLALGGLVVVSRGPHAVTSLGVSEGPLRRTHRSGALEAVSCVMGHEPGHAVGWARPGQGPGCPQHPTRRCVKLLRAPPEEGERS